MLEILHGALMLSSGLISAYLMNRERRDAEGLAGTRLTGWFWSGLFSSLVVIISALMFYLKRSKPTWRRSGLLPDGYVKHVGRMDMLRVAL